jgi:hypothetical protein
MTMTFGMSPPVQNLRTINAAHQRWQRRFEAAIPGARLKRDEFSLNRFGIPKSPDL